MIDSLGIVDTKKIIAAVKDSFGLELQDYNLTTLKRRLIYVLSYFNQSIVDNFVNDVKNNNIDKDEFVDQLMIDSTEMFRDPSFWRELRETYLPEISAAPGSKIWMPGISSGEEIFTLMILLKEAQLQNKVRVVVSCSSQRRIEVIKNGGAFDMKKIEIGEANYVRFTGDYRFSDYYTQQGTVVNMNTDLLDGVEFNAFNIAQDTSSKSYRMIIFRNVLIQYNLPLYEKVIRKLSNGLTVGGYLMLGNKETLDHSEVGKKMQPISADEKVYRKRVD